MANYIITPHAENDIDDILPFIAADNLDAAIAFQERLSKRFELISRKSQNRTRTNRNQRKFTKFSRRKLLDFLS